MVTLREELSHVNNYVMIQKLRFGTRFTYQEDVPDELMETHMPKFIIQPLVENCFVMVWKKHLIWFTSKSGQKMAVAI